jgi:hypothetical protein
MFTIAYAFFQIKAVYFWKPVCVNSAPEYDAWDWFDVLGWVYHH